MEHEDRYSDDEPWYQEHHGSEPEPEATEDEPWYDEHHGTNPEQEATEGESWYDKHHGTDPEPETSEDEPWYERDYDEGHGIQDHHWPSATQAIPYRESWPKGDEDSEGERLGPYYAPPRYHRELQKEYPRRTRKVPTWSPCGSSSKSRAYRTRTQDLPSWSPRASPANKSSRGRAKTKPSIVGPWAKSREQAPRTLVYSPGAISFMDELISIQSQLQYLGEMLGQVETSYTHGESSRNQHSALVSPPTLDPRPTANPDRDETHRRRHDPTVQCRELPTRNEEPAQREVRPQIIPRPEMTRTQPDHEPDNKEDVNGLGGIIEKPAEPPDHQAHILGGTSPGNQANSGRLLTAPDRDQADLRLPCSEQAMVHESSSRTCNEPLGDAKEDSDRVISSLSGAHSAMGSFKLKESPKMAIDGFLHSVMFMTTSGSMLQLGVANTVPPFSIQSAEAVTAQGPTANHLCHFCADQTFVWHPGESPQATKVHDGIGATNTAGLTGEVLSFSLKALFFPFVPVKLDLG
ncbi:PREDICTED: uncharacterized protein LOC104773874 isoform X2 [Camelina sativa]|uniref:Uncharacterized protein LOC104773874 isoform X1 n=1 Tax=Camelina sativa TaxID=90675 RepID=A0ABM0Y7P6_CAMSA|nr:PREDICTED: uncharacterized protein LOC104773874 isoform X1 [Camelina sativa]XP_019098314.1 PREDICTED: uncharacterized protein LOC104773874 isoform X2 [Camelina sativa]